MGYRLFCPIQKSRGRWHNPRLVATGTGGCHPLPGQNISCLPGDWLCSNHMVTGKVVFIPKPGRNSYSGPRDYRSISLTSFLCKTMELLVGKYLRDEALALVPLHPNQHAYQAGKSVETALHQLIVRDEEALDQQETALGVLLDVEGI